MLQHSQGCSTNNRICSLIIQKAINYRTYTWLHNQFERETTCIHCIVYCKKWWALNVQASKVLLYEMHEGWLLIIYKQSFALYAFCYLQLRMLSLIHFLKLRTRVCCPTDYELRLVYYNGNYDLYIGMTTVLLFKRA